MSFGSFIRLLEFSSQLIQLLLPNGNWIWQLLWISHFKLSFRHWPWIEFPSFPPSLPPFLLSSLPPFLPSSFPPSLPLENWILAMRKQPGIQSRIDSIIFNRNERYLFRWSTWIWTNSCQRTESLLRTAENRGVPLYKRRAPRRVRVHPIKTPTIQHLRTLLPATTVALASITGPIPIDPSPGRFLHKLPPEERPTNRLEQPKPERD